MRKVIAIMAGMMALSGCANPKVSYSLAGPGDTGTRFQLAQTVIKFEYPVTKGPGGISITDEKKLTIISVPVPDESVTYTIAGTSEWENWGVKTVINATHRNDTELLQEVGSEVSDTRKQWIADVASAVVAGAGLFLASEVSDPKDEAKSGLPTGLDVTELLNGKKCPPPSEDKEKKGPRECNFDLAGGGIDKVPYHAAIRISAVPKNAVLREKLSVPGTSGSLFYSACRTLDIVVTNKNQADLAASASLRVADPMYVEYLAFPPKGKITLGASCGADAKAEDAGLPDAMDYINASLSAAKSIKEALSKDKKPEDDKSGAK